ncbi:PDZ domain-containing protein [Ancylomarina euxinus]|uniref:PDZ domain-containing protein n=1 Tax=Ancylomarina euxinus TaxID=2283627 RepID=A0A425XWN0_9BACT|nr:trypsin-like peptidase domain-containing protein [Ancylomarina euxinus]MCZ4696367.1 trypsin-like peptidase domain-containing protein [Ancylomarina euxinus]MUP16774.1 PDZ domain-containing protein [Ancylomarina euxinus]RRG19052.1 PDZ domain-containing protein [Ancylomarina euxinus]
MNFKMFLGRVLTAIVGGLIAISVFIYMEDRKANRSEMPTYTDSKFANVTHVDTKLVDLSYAAELSVKSVVHVKTQYGGQSSGSIYDFFFGNGRSFYSQPSLSSGSGVIISDDGYIVTNNHVVRKSDRIEVVLHDKRSFVAKLIGQDASTDLALLKIEGKDFPKMELGDSDSLKLGEWVLAVGNPFNLTSTVTGGIISAKSRNIGIMGGRMSIESFLQTDAAVNPGNSGGALVNSKGQLVGINTAIESRTGSYSGYSFAIPESIFKKVIDDLKKYGEVQRAFLGITIRSVDADLAGKLKLDAITGVYIDGVNKNGAADKAGIRSGDVIIEIDNKKTNTSSELQERISQYAPGDKINILVKRKGKKKHFDLTLRNMIGGTQLINDNQIDLLGAKFQEISKKDMYTLGIPYGIGLSKLVDGKLKRAGIKEGYIIISINNKPISSEDDIRKALSVIEDEGVFISGIYPNGLHKYYAFSLAED